MSDIARELAETICAQLYPEVGEDGIPYLPHAGSVLTVERLIQDAFKAILAENEKLRAVVRVPIVAYFNGVPVSELNEEQKAEYIAYMRSSNP